MPGVCSCRERVHTRPILEYADRNDMGRYLDALACPGLGSFQIAWRARANRSMSAIQSSIYGTWTMTFPTWAFDSR